MRVAFLALSLAFIVSNVRAYADVPDDQGNVVHGVVLIIPASDQCYGLELETPSNFLAPFGGACE